MGGSRLALRNEEAGSASTDKCLSACRYPCAPPSISPLLTRWFLTYAPYFTRRHLHSVRVSGEDNLRAADGLPLLIYMNHPSWWDPMIAALVARRYFPGRRHYAPIDSEALKKYRFFSKLGMFGVEKESFASHRRFLEIGEQLLSQTDSVLWITAQGRFADPRERPLQLSPGLAHLLARSRNIAIIPLAVEYAFWEERTAEALIRFGEPPTCENGSSAAQWMLRLTEQLTHTMDRLATDSVARDTSRFHTIISGRAGVGGVYDLWRGLKLRLRGETFHAAHGEK